MTSKRPRDTNIRKDVAEAIDRAFPDGVIEMPIDPDESYLADIYEKLSTNLSRIDGAAILYGRDPSGGPQWSDESDPDEDPPDWDEPPSSYWLCFVGLTEQRLNFEVEILEPDENDEEQRIDGIGIIGCSVGVSLLAPFAIVMLDTIEEYETGSRTCPDIEPSVLDLNLQPLDLDDHFRETYTEEQVQAVRALRDSITGILEALGIAVLPDEELQKAVPWLRVGPETFVGNDLTGRGLTVRGAFFHRGE